MLLTERLAHTPWNLSWPDAVVIMVVVVALIVGFVWVFTH